MAEKIPLKVGEGNVLLQQFASTDTVPATNLPVMVGDIGSGGTKGAVPAPSAGDAAASKFLKADGTWSTAGGSSPSIITPAQITSQQDDYTPTGWSTATIVRLSFDSAMSGITGFAAGSDGEEKVLINVGTQHGYLGAENAASTAANRISSFEFFEAGGMIRIVYDSTTSRWRAISNSFNTSKIGVSILGQHHFIMPGSNQQADHNMINFTLSGTSAITDFQVPTSARPHGWTLETGTTSSGVSTIYIAKNNFAFSSFGGAMMVGGGTVSMGTLSTSAQRYTAQVSLLPGANSGTLAVNNSVGIRYSDNVNSGKWQCFTRNTSGTETTVDSGITVATNTLYLLRVQVNKSNSEVSFFINNVLVGRSTTNLPTTGTLAGLRVMGIASVGTTNKIVTCYGLFGTCIYPN